MNTNICTRCDQQTDYADSYCRHCGALLATTGRTSPLDETLLDRRVFNRRRGLPPILARLLGFAAVFLVCLFVYLTLWNTKLPDPVAQSSDPVIASSPDSPAFRYPNKPKHMAYSISMYYDRRWWENAIYDRIHIEDFEQDESNVGELSFPYSTGNKFVLEGQSVATILDDKALLPTGNLLHLTDWQVGSTLRFPNDTAVTAVGFDYQTAEDWTIVFSESAMNGSLNIPKNQKAFVGIVFTDGNIDWFRLASNSDQGGLSIDNISFVAATAP